MLSRWAIASDDHLNAYGDRAFVHALSSHISALTTEGEGLRFELILFRRCGRWRYQCVNRPRDSLKGKLRSVNNSKLVQGSKVPSTIRPACRTCSHIWDGTRYHARCVACLAHDVDEWFGCSNRKQLMNRNARRAVGLQISA